MLYVVLQCLHVLLIFEGIFILLQSVLTMFLVNGQYNVKLIKQCSGNRKWFTTNGCMLE